MQQKTESSVILPLYSKVQEAFTPQSQVRPCCSIPHCSEETVRLLVKLQTGSWGSKPQQESDFIPYSWDSKSEISALSRQESKADIATLLKASILNAPL